MNSGTAIMTAILNTFLFVDLYLIIINPFFDRHKRARAYFAVTAFCTITLSVFSGIYTRKYQTGIEVNDFGEGDNAQETIFISFFAIMGTVTIVSLLLSLKQLTRKGTSKQLRMQVLYRYLLYFFCYIDIFISFAKVCILWHQG